MHYYFFKLSPPREGFPSDMTPEESRVMQAHFAYWSGLMAKGQVIAFGPVADPRGAFGVGLVQLEDGVDPQALADGDPAVAAGIGFTAQILPMPRLVLRP